MDEKLGMLPAEPMDRLSQALSRFLRIEATSGLLLLACALVALGVANSPWALPVASFWSRPVQLNLAGLEYASTLKSLINNGLMTLFFFLVALELKREIVLGELTTFRSASLSLSAALGGMIAPAGIYLLMVEGGAAVHGWGTAMTTDTAFLVGCLAVLGRRVPQSLRVFLLSLAIFDDIGAILVIALGYGEHMNGTAALLALLGLAVVAAAARLGIRSIAVYFLLGALVWLALDRSGIHPTLAGVILGLMTPARSWVSDTRLHAILDRLVAAPDAGKPANTDSVAGKDLRRARVATREAVSPVERLELGMHPWVAFAIMPLFALANAGVPLSVSGTNTNVALAIFLSLVLGKPIGVAVFSYAAVAAGLAVRPADLPWRILFCGAILTGIGFTMALLIAELAFDASLANSAKTGILGASLASATAGMLALAWAASSSRRQRR